MKEKACKSCTAVKPVSAFYRNDGMRDGFTSKCIECIKTTKDKQNDRSGHDRKNDERSIGRAENHSEEAGLYSGNSISL